ncbi:MAG TPA: VWA domain-containing protein [Acidobacteriota bacterium]|nr:VWA domain-containing protein [Acidobacteriota bacterium]
MPLPPILYLALLALLPLSAQGAQEPAPYEGVSIEANRGDQLIIRNHRGRVQVSPGNGSRVEVRYLKHAAREAEGDLQVLLVRHRHRIMLHTYNLGDPAAWTDLQVRIPADLEVSLNSISAQVHVRELKGLVKVETLRGPVILEDLQAEVLRAYSRSGTIRLISRVQPGETVQLSTDYGEVECDLASGLDLQLSVTTGGTVSWDGYPSAFGKLERSLGRAKRASTLQIASHAGDVSIRQGDEARLLEGGADEAGPAATDRPPPVPASQPPALRPPQPEAAPQGAEGDQQDVPEEGVFRVNVDRVRLNAVVRHQETGALQAGLKAEDFRLWEDGVEQPLTNFMSGQEPFHLLLLLDVSGSTADYIRLLRQATVRFIEQMRPSDRIAVATFSQQVRWISGFTQDRELLKRAVRRLRPEGATALYEAVHQALGRLGQIEGRKALVIFSDGVDDSLLGDFESAPDRTFLETYQAALESDSILYTIHLDTQDFYGSALEVYGNVIAEMAYREARGQLRRLAQLTGGRLYQPSNAGQLSPAYEEIAEELRSLYTLAYQPPSSPSAAYKRIQVKVAGRPQLAVRHRRGYY